MLDDMAVEAGFADYPAMVRHDPARGGSPSEQVVRRRLAATAALDPERGSRTTAFEMVSFLQTIWWDEAGPAAACAAVRRYMGQQLTRHRIASGFGHDVSVAAKSGGLMGVVRNEAGVVTFPDDRHTPSPSSPGEIRAPASTQRLSTPVSVAWRMHSSPS